MGRQFRSRCSSCHKAGRCRCVGHDMRDMLPLSCRERHHAEEHLFFFSKQMIKKIFLKIFSYFLLSVLLQKRCQNLDVWGSRNNLALKKKKTVRKNPPILYFPSFPYLYTAWLNDTFQWPCLQKKRPPFPMQWIRTSREKSLGLSHGSPSVAVASSKQTCKFHQFCLHR